MNAPELLTQNSEEWRQSRCGYVGASCYSDVLAKGQGKTRAAYMRRIVAERLTGKPIETYHNGHMERGNTQEPLARMAYERLTGAIVQEVGFIRHAELATGCSPDGIIDDDGGVEIKSVIPTVQIETVLRGSYPPEHKPQIQGSLWNTRRRWWDFVSFCPDMPKRLQLYVFRVEPDEAYIEALEKEVRAFLAEVDALYQRLQTA